MTLTATETAPPDIEAALRVVTDPRRTMTCAEVGRELLRCSAKTVRKYIQDEGLPAIPLGNEYRLQRGSVLRWMDEREGRLLA